MHCDLGTGGYGAMGVCWWFHTVGLRVCWGVGTIGGGLMQACTVGALGDLIFLNPTLKWEWPWTAAELE